MEGRFILKGEEVDNIFGGVWKLRFPQAWHLTHESIDVNQQDQFNLAGLYDIHIMSNKLNRLRRSTLNNRHFERSKQIPNVSGGISRSGLTPFPCFTRYTHDRVRLGMNSSYLALCCNTVMNILPAGHYTYTCTSYCGRCDVWLISFMRRAVTKYTQVLSYDKT